MSTLYGWFFDAYPAGEGMTAWFIDEGGRTVPLRDRFTPTFHVHGPQPALRSLCLALRAGRTPLRLKRTERLEVFQNRSLEVLAVGVPVPGLLPTVFRQALATHPDLTYYDGDLSLAHCYVLERGLFPLARCAVEHQQGRIRELQVLDSPWALDYNLPALRTMALYIEGDGGHPRRGLRGDLLVEVEGRSHRFDRRRGRSLLLGIRHLLERHDPDLLVSAYGDSYILPRLLELARHYRIPLPLNRDPRRAVLQKRAHSYFSYGMLMHREQQHLLFGRWHIDRQNAFSAALDRADGPGDYGLDGALEIARISGLPAQVTSRASTGTAISAMQIATALRRGALVPWQKRQPEALKSGMDLLRADKGGLVYAPIGGLHEHVAELDFSAMYPSIMVRYNVSPETVGPAPEGLRAEGDPGADAVPELGIPVRRDRVGLVPETLAPLLEKRMAYKRLIQSLSADNPHLESYRRRYSAHKWMLVTCFGYLGYKNARFGRIEAHEAVSAYGREMLLRAKELVERQGFRVLHLYVDGLWIHKPAQPARPDYETLLEQIRAATGLHIALEGVYRWIAFLPSRTDPRLTVANRYFGAFEDGSLKVRGIEARRRDTTDYVRETQMEMLSILAQGRDAAGFRACLPQAVAYAQERFAHLRQGRAPQSGLAVTQRLSRAPGEYRVRTIAARVAGQLKQAGVPVRAGERLRFLLVPGPARARPWELLPDVIPYDRDAYCELLLRAVETVLTPAGVDRGMLENWLIANAGYWGPPGALPPPGADPAEPLFHAQPAQPAAQKRLKASNAARC